MPLQMKAMIASFFACVAGDAAPPHMMRAAKASGACTSPFACVGIKTVPTPVPKEGQVLIRVAGTSVNPSDVDTVELGGCAQGCGHDLAGTVVACPNCTRLKVGDAVWAMGPAAFAEYAVVPEESAGLAPTSLELHAAGTLPEVSVTSYFSLKRTMTAPGSPIPGGSPWAGANFSNLTVVITSGAGGTGFMGIQLAKAWGAKNIITATTGNKGLAFVKYMGATFVTDYHVMNIFDALPNSSVDIVYDNYAAPGAADKAMRVLRPGGMYLMLPHGECYLSKAQGPPCLSATPKAGVRQLNYDTSPDFAAHTQQGLEELSGLFAAGQLVEAIARNYTLADIAKALDFSSGHGEGGVGHHYGKIAVAVPASGTSPSVLV